MATANVKTTTVTTINTTVTLQLSQAEAETLRSMFYRTGGSPDQSRRKHADSMSRAIDSAFREAGVAITTPKKDDMGLYGFSFADGGL